MLLLLFFFTLGNNTTKQVEKCRDESYPYNTPRRHPDDVNISLYSQIVILIFYLFCVPHIFPELNRADI